MKLYLHNGYVNLQDEDRQFNVKITGIYNLSTSCSRPIGVGFSQKHFKLMDGKLAVHCDMLAVSYVKVMLEILCVNL